MTEHTTPNSRTIITRMLALQVVLAAANLFLVMLFSFKNSHLTDSNKTDTSQAATTHRIRRLHRSVALCNEKVIVGEVLRRFEDTVVHTKHSAGPLYRPEL